ncbi:hypothetical protein ACKWTF_012743 [Chironomus riparius]
MKKPKNMRLLSDIRLKGSKIELIVPLILLLVLNLIAIINLECCIISFLVFPVIIAACYIWFAKKHSRTNIFLALSVISCIYIVFIFEFTLPLLELLPQENFIFVTFIFLTVYFFYKTYNQSALNKLGTSEPSKETFDSSSVTLISPEDEDLIESDDQDSDLPNVRNSCSSCKKYIPARTFHCNICKSCIIGRDHHNYFFNCCIGRFNHKYFLLGCLSCIFTLLLFANLALTSICHPFAIFQLFGIMFLLPDDCSEVFNDIEISLCFVAAIYALEMALVLLFVIIQQLVLISKGTTSTEYCFKKEKSLNRYSCFRNWKNFCYI